MCGAVAMWEHKPTKWTKSNYHVPGPVSHIGSWTHTAKVIVSGYETLQRRHPLVTLPQYRIYRDKIGYLDWLDSANVHQEGRWVLAQSNPLESGCPHLASDSWCWHFEAATRLQKESTRVAADKSLSMQRGAKKTQFVNGMRVGRHSNNKAVWVGLHKYQAS